MSDSLHKGLRNVEVYEKDGEFFLKILIRIVTKKGDIYENTLDGIKLDLYIDQDITIKQIDNIGWCDYFSAEYRHLINDYSYYLCSGGHEYKINNDECEQTSTLIKKHTERYTMEELEKKLGCHLEIITNKEDE